MEMANLLAATYHNIRQLQYMMASEGTFAMADIKSLNEAADCVHALYWRYTDKQDTDIQKALAEFADALCERTPDTN